jgi:predicted transcriptional regulator
MNNLNSSVNNSFEWRRSKVQELASQGYNQSETSRILQISQPTTSRDITYLRQQAKDNIKRYIDEGLPEEYEKCLVGLNAIAVEKDLNKRLFNSQKKIFVCYIVYVFDKGISVFPSFLDFWVVTVYLYLLQNFIFNFFIIYDLEYLALSVQINHS